MNTTNFSCEISGCRRRPSKTSGTGLCHTHHRLLAEDNESPLALTHGEWVTGRRGGVKVWRSLKAGA